MTWNRIIVFAVICTLKSKADLLSDLDYYYLDTVGTQSNQTIPQDGEDAQTIIDSKNNPDVIARLLLHRDKIRRININKEIIAKDYERSLVSGPYRVQGNENPLQDLYFILVKNENMVIGTYLRNFFYAHKGEPYMIIAFILTKDMEAMIQTYDKKWIKNFKSGRKNQNYKLEHLLRVWVRHNRERNEKEDLTPEIIQKDVDALITEYKSDGWKENRDQLELVLIKKSIKYSREVIKGFQAANKNSPMEQIINESVDKHGLNKDLANAYSSLARYIKDRPQYMADILRQFSEGKDEWAVWLMCIAVTFPEEWIKIDECFRKADNKNISLSKFILEKVTNEDYHMFASMVSQIVDATNKGPSKPTTIPLPAPAPSSQPPAG